MLLASMTIVHILIIPGHRIQGVCILLTEAPFFCNLADFASTSSIYRLYVNSVLLYSSFQSQPALFNVIPVCALYACQRLFSPPQPALLISQLE